MRCKKAFTLLIGLFTLFMFIGYLPLFAEDTQKNNIFNKPCASNIDPFIIDGNWSALEGNSWFTGQGTWKDPYKIEDITINVNHADKDGIYIRDSNKYFILENCTIINASIGNNGGIHLYNAHNGTLLNNHLIGNDRNLFIDRSNNCSIRGNTINTGGDGIYDYRTENCTYVNNQISNCTYYGFDTTSSLQSNFTRNILLNNTGGIHNQYADNLTISENNILFDGTIGIYNWMGNDNLIYNNSIRGGGTFFSAQDDDCSGTQWDNGEIGNYWGDYTERYPSAGNDGKIWDTPYEIEGTTTGFYDNYPLVYWSLPLNASFSANTTSIMEGDYVSFLDKTNGGKKPYSYNWSFGDLTPNSTEQNPDHQYQNAGTYEVILTVQDAENTVSIHNLEIKVSNFDATPEVNHPDNIFTTADGTETIDWIITDDGNNGNYRVLANNTLGNTYTWISDTSWFNNTNLAVSINKTLPGIFNYTIIYYDNMIPNFGDPDSVTVTIIDNVPTATNDGNIQTRITDNPKINWTLNDDYGGGEYRVLANNSLGNNYVWCDWTSWNQGSQVSLDINTTQIGRFNYTIEYYDNGNNYGALNSILVEILEDNMPISTHPNDIGIYKSGSEMINWTLNDDWGAGQYRVIANNTAGNYYIWKDWRAWENGVVLNVEINRTATGFFNYTIEFYDDRGQFGISDSIIIEIQEKPTEGTNNQNDETEDDGDITQPPLIPGYDLTYFLLVSLISVTLILKKPKEEGA